MSEIPDMLGVVRLAGVLLIAGCFQNTPSQIDPIPDGPGSEAWGNPSVACVEDSECLGSEMCQDNICQMKRCQDGPYTTAPPVGREFIFYNDMEIAVSDSSPYDGGYWLDAYLPSGGAAPYGGSFDVDTQPLADIAGGNLIPGRPGEFLAAVTNRQDVRVFNANEARDVAVGFTPVAVAAGDITGDGIDEVFALSADAELAICQVSDGVCNEYAFAAGIKGIDLAAADIDGDNIDEAVMLIDADGLQVHALNADYEDSNQELSFGFIANASLDRISAGDLDGDGIAEVIGLDERGCGFFGCGDDKLWIYSLNSSESLVLGEHGINDNALDVEVADIDMDEKFEVLVLRDNRRVKTYRAHSVSNLSTLFESETSVDASPTRVTAGDYDGDSPAGVMKSGPKMVFGRPVPLFAAFYPPYWREHSDTAANVYVGRSDLQTETLRDTVMMRTQVELGVQGEIPGIFSASVSTKINETLEQSVFTRKVEFVGDRVWTQARPELYGPHYGGVMLAYSCAHTYTYEMDDPAGVTDSHGKEFMLVVPVDQATTFLSTMRYNGLAEALGGLPIIDVPHTIGNPTTYPSMLVDLDGEPIPDEDIVVNDPPRYLVSDVGFTGFWYALWDYVGYENAMRAEVNLVSALNIPGFKFGAEVGGGFGNSYSIEIGEEAQFGGLAPTLPDDPSTPTDEYAANAYTWAPIIYKEHYEDLEGNDASFYVYHFMVGL